MESTKFRVNCTDALNQRLETALNRGPDSLCFIPNFETTSDEYEINLSVFPKRLNTFVDPTNKLKMLPVQTDFTELLSFQSNSNANPMEKFELNNNVVGNEQMGNGSYFIPECHQFQENMQGNLMSDNIIPQHSTEKLSGLVKNIFLQTSGMRNSFVNTKQMNIGLTSQMYLKRMFWINFLKSNSSTEAKSGTDNTHFMDLPSFSQNLNEQKSPIYKEIIDTCHLYLYIKPYRFFFQNKTDETADDLTNSSSLEVPESIDADEQNICKEQPLPTQSHALSDQSITTNFDNRADAVVEEKLAEEQKQTTENDSPTDQSISFKAVEEIYNADNIQADDVNIEVNQKSEENMNDSVEVNKSHKVSVDRQKKLPVEPKESITCSKENALKKVPNPQDIKNNGEKIFRKPTKLFVFDNLSIWKKKGEGQIEIWKETISGNYYMLLTDRNTGHLLLHMRLDGNWNTSYLSNTNNSCLWAYYNYANRPEGIRERLACLFRDSDVAEQFLNAVADCTANSRFNLV